MPHLKSAKKRMRQDALKRVRNRATLKDLKTQVKKLLTACKDGNAAAAKTELAATFSKLDKCGARGYIHKNAVGRHKQRLTARVAKIGTEPVKPAKPAAKAKPEAKPKAPKKAKPASVAPPAAPAK